MADNFEEQFNDSGFGCTSLTGVSSPENLFSIFESLENETMNIAPFSAFDDALFSPKEMMSKYKSSSSQASERSKARRHELDYEDEAFLPKKKSKVSPTNEEVVLDGQHKVSHIAVERNRRKQMNEHLTVLRSLMPCFYVKRGDQASIIGGVVDYIKELQQVLQSLEAKKQRKVYNEVLSPRPLISSPRPPPHSPRVNLPISPRTPQSGSPYKPRMQNPNYINIITPSSHESSPKSLDSSTDQLAVNSTSSVADVEVKFSGPNVLLNTVSSRIPGQTLKIVSALEGHALEILQVNINSTDDAMLNSFTIKIGIECELSAEELAQEVLQTFSERSAQ